MSIDENENSEEFSTNEDEFNENFLAQQGFETIMHKSLKWANGEKHTYNVYSDKVNFESIDVESIIFAMNEGKITSPYKIVNTHSRIPDILVAEDLIEVPLYIEDPIIEAEEIQLDIEEEPAEKEEVAKGKDSLEENEDTQDKPQEEIESPPTAKPPEGE